MTAAGHKIIAFAGIDLIIAGPGIVGVCTGIGRAGGGTTINHLERAVALKGVGTVGAEGAVVKGGCRGGACAGQGKDVLGSGHETDRPIGAQLVRAGHHMVGHRLALGVGPRSGPDSGA